MNKHTFRGALTAWMVLIALRTVGTAGGSSKVATLFTDANAVINHALSPTVPAIPDRRGATPAAAPAGGSLPLATRFDQYSAAATRTPVLGHNTPS